MHSIYRYLAVGLLMLGCLALVEIAPAFGGKPSTKPAAKAAPKTRPNTVVKTTIKNVRTNPLLKAQVAYRTPGQRAYIVQARLPGSIKTPLMTQMSAVVLRTQLLSQGYSAHIHNFGDQGALVHYNLGQWRPQAIFLNSQQANQAVAMLQTYGLNARVVVR
jgi:hypothetical protein